MTGHLPPPPYGQQDTNPYAPPGSPVEDHGYAPERPEKASRLARLAAKILDNLILWALPFLFMFGAAFFAEAKGSDAAALGGFCLFFVWIAAVCGINAWLIHDRGQTIGKMLIKIKIVHSNYTPISLLRVFGLRFLIPTVLGMVPFVGGIFSLIDILFIFGEEKRCIHDLIADTIVVEVY